MTIEKIEDIEKASTQELIDYLKYLHDAIYNRASYNWKDLLLYHEIKKELEKRGCEVKTEAKVEDIHLTDEDEIQAGICQECGAMEWTETWTVNYDYEVTEDGIIEYEPEKTSLNLITCTKCGSNRVTLFKTKMKHIRELLKHKGKQRLQKLEQLIKEGKVEVI